jgi:DNA replication protein DnaC
MENVSDDAPMHPATKVRICSKHGPYESEHLAGSIYMPCDKCMAENDERRKAEEAAEAESKPAFNRAASRLLWAGVTKRFEHATFETYHAENPKQKAVLERVQSYAENFRDHFKVGRSLMMVGRPGTGKSHLGFAILRQLMDASEQFTGRMIGVSELFRSIKDTWSRGSKKTEKQAIADLIAPHLLIVDEIGVQFDSPAEQSLLYEVINGRYLEMLPTVVISNLTRGELSEVIGARSFDRLRENGGLLETFDWESHRR